jgi:molybdopterin synthase catalytic subunit
VAGEVVAIFVAVGAGELSIMDAIDHCSAPGHGAAALFVGRVRDLNDGRTVQGVSYDVHDALCRRVFERLCQEAVATWGDDLRLWLAHRHGRLAVGEASVVAAASSRHRDDAFRACRYLVEQMKRRAPIWKQEHYVDGDSAWIAGHPLETS